MGASFFYITGKVLITGFEQGVQVHSEQLLPYASIIFIKRLVVTLTRTSGAMRWLRICEW